MDNNSSQGKASTLDFPANSFATQLELANQATRSTGNTSNGEHRLQPPHLLTVNPFEISDSLMSPRAARPHRSLKDLLNILEMVIDIVGSDDFEKRDLCHRSTEGENVPSIQKSASKIPHRNHDEE
jgi:hypothetical protein